MEFMKSIKINLISSVVALGFAGSFVSCDSTGLTEDQIDVIPSEQAVPLELGEINIADFSRSVFEGKGFSIGDSIGVRVTQNGTLCDNMHAIFDGYSWELWQPVYVTPGEFEVCAYYPYQEEMDSEGSMMVIPQDNEQPDVMTATTWGYYDGTRRPVVNLSFKHMLSRVTLKVRKDNLFPGEGWFESASIANSEIVGVNSFETRSTLNGYLSAVIGVYFSWVEGIPSVLETSDVPFTINADVMLEENATRVVDFLVPDPTPFGINSPNSRKTYYVNIAIVVDGKKYLVKNLKPEWNIGKQYTYNVLLSGDPYGYPVVIVESPEGEITQWVDKGDEDLSTL